VDELRKNYEEVVKKGERFCKEKYYAVWKAYNGMIVSFVSITSACSFPAESSRKPS
jgi:hypothetical protein